MCGFIQNWDVARMSIFDENMMKTQWILPYRSTTTIKSRMLEPVWNETLTDKHRYAPWLNMLLEMSIIDSFEELDN